MVFFRGVRGLDFVDLICSLFGLWQVLETTLVVVPGPLDSKESTLGGSGFPVSIAGVPGELVVTARDTYGNQLVRGGSFVRVVLRSEGMSVVQSEIGITDNDDGTYTGFFQRGSAGNYTIQASIDGLELGVKALYLQVSAPAPSPPCLRAVVIL